MQDIRDFAVTIAFPIGNVWDYPTGTWQELNWNPAYSDNHFFNFCHNVTNPDSPTAVRAVDWALANYTGGQPWTNLGNYAEYIKRVILPTCPTNDYDSLDCFGKQNATQWADVSNTLDRSYLYTNCVENGIYITAPQTGPSLISRVLTVNYMQEWCRKAFPPGKYNRIPETPNLDYWNKYGGFDIKLNRTLFIDGGKSTIFPCNGNVMCILADAKSLDADVWTDTTYHSTLAPSRPYSDERPEYLISGGGHHWDS